jgi:hypothetical protein
MQFMMLVKTSRKAENNPPQTYLIKLMNDDNDQLEEAGVHDMSKGLYPNSEAVKIQFIDQYNPPLVTYGPFLEDQNQVAGFNLIDVKTKEEALEWLLKAPDPQGFGEGEIELSQVR